MARATVTVCIDPWVRPFIHAMAKMTGFTMGERFQAAVVAFVQDNGVRVVR